MTDSDPASLLRAYLDAVYTVAEADGERTFRIGEALPFVVPAAYLTAWNPHSRDASRTDNARSSESLASALRARGAALLRARSAAPDGSHCEAGWLALGLDSAVADACAHAFGQNAIVYALPGDVARMRCYAANFGTAQPPPGVDTRFVDWLP
jgi:hypothetical protein